MDIQHGLKITSKSNALREAAHLEEFLCLCVCEIRSISKEFPAYLSHFDSFLLEPPLEIGGIYGLYWG